MPESLTDYTIMANLSGGLDSVYGVYLLLTRGERVLVHHCNLGGNRRVRWETAASRAARDWYRSVGLTAFRYVESEATLPRGFDDDGWRRNRRTIRDAELVMTLAGAVLRAERGVRRLAYFNNARDSSTRYPRSRETRARITALQRTARRRIRIERPLRRLTKAQIVAAMPRELVELASWCRFPDDNGQPCHRCHTCKSVDRALEVVSHDDLPHLLLDNNAART